MFHAERQAAKHQCNSVGNPQAHGDHRDDGGWDQQPDNGLVDEIGLQGLSRGFDKIDIEFWTFP